MYQQHDEHSQPLRLMRMVGREGRERYEVNPKNDRKRIELGRLPMKESKKCHQEVIHTILM